MTKHVARQPVPACGATKQEDKVETEMSLLEGIVDSPSNPLAVVEDIASDNNWAFERSGEDEVTIVTKGQWTDYQLSFTWMSEIEALHLACAFDMKIPPARRPEVQRLVAAINEQLWIGHFDLWIPQPICWTDSDIGCADSANHIT